MFSLAHFKQAQDVESQLVKSVLVQLVESNHQPQICKRNVAGSTVYKSKDVTTADSS